MNQDRALEILGLNPNPSATQLKRAYREQVRLWHPDRYSHGSAMKPLAEKHLQDANLAYAFLERRLSQAAPARPSGGSGTVRAHAPHRPSPSVGNRVGDLFQAMAHLKRLFPKIDFNSVLQGLRHDARNAFRPWYRYPDSSATSVSQGGKAASFSRILHNTLRRPAGLERLGHRSPSRRPTDGGDNVTPVSGISDLREAEKK